MHLSFLNVTRRALASALLLVLLAIPAVANPETTSPDPAPVTDPGRTQPWPLRLSSLLRTGILGMLALTALPQVAAAEPSRSPEALAVPRFPLPAGLTPEGLLEALAAAKRSMAEAAAREAEEMEAYRLGRLERQLAAVECRGRIVLAEPEAAARPLQVLLQWDSAREAEPGSLRIADAQGDLLEGRVHALEVLAWSPDNSGAERIGFWGTDSGARPFSGTVSWKDETFSLAIDKGAGLAGFPATPMVLAFSTQGIQNREPAHE